MTDTVTVDSDNDELADRIDETRLEYPSDPERPAIVGSPFTLEFDEPVDPEAFCEEISTAEDPWRMFGLKLQLAGERTDENGDVVASEYWSVAGVLFHVEDGEEIDASKIDLEITSEWVRVYVKSECCEERAAEFIPTIDQEYDIDVKSSIERGAIRHDIGRPRSRADRPDCVAPRELGDIGRGCPRDAR